jgi:DNA polymerase-3 subunit delta'
MDAQAAAFEHALAIGRLHHAWLLSGPEGLGKASFAYRAARRLLGAKPAPAFGGLGSDPDDKVFRLIASQSHPDLLVLERGGEGSRKVIPVDEARRLPEFFSKAPALGPYRVAIIDAVDDFNANGANAVLKTLEEPSGRGVLFLISHAAGRLLPTIRSRCRTLTFRPWPASAIAEIAAAAGLDPSQAERIAALADGSPGRAAAVTGSDALMLDVLAHRLANDPGSVERSLLIAMAESFRGGEGASRFAMMGERLAAAARARALAGGPAEASARWSALWDRLTRLAPSVEGVNLDRGDAFWTAVRDIEATARAAC